MSVGITAGEIMHKGIITVRENARVREAARMLKRALVGGLIVTRGEDPVGIITEGDIVSKVVAEAKDPDHVKVKDVMSTPVRTVKKSTDIEEVARIMRDARVDRLPVTGEDNRIIGIITERDLVKAEPALIELTREQAELEAPQETGQGTFFSGECESCGNYSTQLKMTAQGLLCPECRGE